jgi:hypothetical protein
LFLDRMSLFIPAARGQGLFSAYPYVRWSCHNPPPCPLCPVAAEPGSVRGCVCWRPFVAAGPSSESAHANQCANARKDNKGQRRARPRPNHRRFPLLCLTERRQRTPTATRVVALFTRRLWVRFPRDPPDNPQVRGLPGHRWSAVPGAWSVPGPNSL